MGTRRRAAGVRRSVACDRARAGPRPPCGRPWLPCGRGNRDGACAPICLVDRSASRLSGKSPQAAGGRRSIVSSTWRPIISRSHLRALAIYARKAPFQGLPACSKSRGLYERQGLPVNARRDLVIGAGCGAPKSAELKKDPNRGLGSGRQIDPFETLWRGIFMKLPPGFVECLSHDPGACAKFRGRACRKRSHPTFASSAPASLGLQVAVQAAAFGVRVVLVDPHAGPAGGAAGPDGRGRGQGRSPAVERPDRRRQARPCGGASGGLRGAGHVDPGRFRLACATMCAA